MHNNINIKRRSHLAVDPNEFILDLLEHKINENQLINNCISNMIPEKARPLVWTILLNLIPLNKPEEWSLYFKKFREFYKNKIENFLKIKESNNEEEDQFDYEEINRNLRLVNNENVQKSNFTNVNCITNVKVSSMTSVNLNQIEKKGNNFNTQKEITFEKFESEENKKNNAADKNDSLIKTEKIKLININSDSNNNNNNNNVFDIINEKRDLELNTKDITVNSHCGKFISEAYKKDEKIFSKEEAQIFELIQKNPKTNKFYMFYPQDQSVSIEKLSQENSEISEASYIIKLDIERTFQEIDLFKTTETKEILCKTLFIWYCDNADLGYKQGMNEILGTIFYASFNTNEAIFERLSNKQNEKESKHKDFLNLIESEEFFQANLYTLFDQILALGVKSIYNYHNFVEAKEFAYTEEYSNFDFIKDELNEIVKNYKVDFNKNQNEDKNVFKNEIVKENYTGINGILEKNDFEFVSKLNNNNASAEKKEKQKFFNLENFSSFLLNKKERAKNNLNDSFKSIKDFILKRSWDFKKKSSSATAANNNNQKQKNKYKQCENNSKKIDFKIFESENMDRLNLEEILNLEQSDLRRRVNIIFFYYLKSYDPELYNHLLHKIDPYIIIFRWILCLFNREISLKYVLYIWDCIFAIEFLEKNSALFVKSFKSKPYRNFVNNFNFVNFICVSIFEDVKKELLLEEEACYVLQMLMHFPNEKNVKEIVKRALKIRNFVYDKLHIKNEFVFID